MPVIQQLRAREILDSRGRPTVKTSCLLQSGATGLRFSSVRRINRRGRGAGIARRRPNRYRGLGCRRAVAGVNGEINAALAGVEFSQQKELDGALLKLDGTANKSRLGANALLSVSLAFARAVPAERKCPLYSHFADMIDNRPRHLPRPAINLFSGGRHAGGQVDIQDILIVPASAGTMDEALAMTYEIFQCAADLTLERYGARALRADEGGLAPPAPGAAALLDDAVAAIKRAGLTPGRDACLAVDVAASHFYRDGHYELDGKQLSAAELVIVLTDWTRQYPIVSIEDGLAEEDWTSWPVLRAALAGRAMVVGDDLLCTNPERIRRAAAAAALMRCC